jgi:hypothetical protein
VVIVIEIAEAIEDTAGDSTPLAGGIEVVVGPSLAVHVGPCAGPASSADIAKVAIAIADAELACAMTAAVADAIRGAAAAAGMTQPGDLPVVRLRSRKRLACVAGALAGAIAIVHVTARNARHLVALIDGIRAAGAAGVQLVWDGAEPPRAEVERHVFAALERARAMPNEAPVVLAASGEPVSALHLLVAHRASLRKDEPR